MALIPTNGTEMAYETHKRVYGEQHHDRLVDQAIEEMAELTAKLVQQRRGRAVGNLDIIEEAIDVTLCLDFLLRDLHVGYRDAQLLASELAGKLDTKLSVADRRGELKTAVRAKL